MDLSQGSSSVDDNSPGDCSFKAYNKEIVRRAEIQCDLKIRQANIQKLTEDINALAKELKRECLTEKWGNAPRPDGSKRVRPEHQAAKLCREIAENPECIDDMLMKLRYQKATLQSQVAQVMSELKEYMYEDVID